MQTEEYQIRRMYNGLYIANEGVDVILKMNSLELKMNDFHSLLEQIRNNKDLSMKEFDNMEEADTELKDNNEFVYLIYSDEDRELRHRLFYMDNHNKIIKNYLTMKLNMLSKNGELTLKIGKTEVDLYELRENWGILEGSDNGYTVINDIVMQYRDKSQALLITW